jgi:hypothetical protein
MNMLLRLSFFCVSCFIYSLTYAAYDSTDPAVIPNVTPRTLCAEVYVNNVKMTSTDQNTTVTPTDCQFTYSAHPARYYLTNSGVVGTPIIVSRVDVDSVIDCPADRPIPKTVILHADEATGWNTGHIVYSVNAYCCKAGLTMRVEMKWVQGTTCP